MLLPLLLIFCAHASADSWYISDAPIEVFSADGQWRLDVHKQEAQLRRIGSWSTPEQWTLVNEPVDFYLANDGTLVTLDTCCSMGYGNAVVVIYRPDGSLVRQLALSDLLLENDIEALQHSVSSIWWRDRNTRPRIDEKARRMTIEITGPPRNVELTIDLDTGEVIEPKVRRFWGVRFGGIVSFGPREASSEPCEGGVWRSSEDLLADAAETLVAIYPPVAVKARVAGSVIAQLAIGENGAVEDVKIVKPLPFGLDRATRAAVQSWRFHPAAHRRCGLISMNFGIAEIPSPPLD